ncbi:sigma-54 interaction domain-containing protein [Pseudogracilibacillus auburnensis]|uniref:PAS domain S-box-containing protein n=1 Tax=Pseudogracilibacillus auburnensis TaxID=1494959 RepID=A0A2V3VND4_9BACI|nr:sigma 54-interacting transcriptional regulator [Pseudogracilibacillus auburnensis]PXW83322.1 PAS domain S-box-containing protein [Pseudogracilibacillus auburnensis]
MNTSKIRKRSDGHSIETNSEWLKSVLLSIHDGVLVIDKEGIVKLINPEYTRITGVTAEQIIGKPLKEVRANAQLIEVLKDRRERVGIYRKEGEVEYVVDMAPIFVDNEIVGAVSICKGLTEVHKLVQQLKRDRDHLQKQIGSIHQAKYTFDQIIGADGGLFNVIQIAKKIAKSDLPILISGESGTGKELFAQSIHNESQRAKGPFIPVNCATIPASLIESELFGYEEGSFTNSKKGGKIGLFEMANGGTIFLDEIGELSYELQAKFLRVLEEQTIRKIGGTRVENIDVRVIAATNRDLNQLIDKGMFREDLFYRLNVLRLMIPPLRERRADIPKIIDHILFNRSNDKHVNYTINQETLNLLQSLKWSGNVRELKNTIEFAVCLSDTSDIKEKHLPEFIRNNRNETNINSNATLKEITERAEYEQLTSVLAEYDNSLEEKKEISQKLGISIATLYNKLKKYGIDF